MTGSSNKKKKLIKIEVAGEDPSLWLKLKPKLMESINKFLDSAIDFDKGTTVRDQGKKLISLAINYAEEKLKRPQAENNKIEAEISELYSRTEKNKEEARINRVKADDMEFNSAVNKLRLSLRLTKAMIIGKEDQESVVFTKQIELFLEALDEFSSADGGDI